MLKLINVSLVELVLHEISSQSLKENSFCLYLSHGDVLVNQGTLKCLPEWY